MEISSVIDCYNEIVVKQYTKGDSPDISKGSSYLFNPNHPLYVSGWVYRLKMDNGLIVLDFVDPRKSTTKTRWIPIALLQGGRSFGIRVPTDCSGTYSLALVSADERRPEIVKLEKLHKKLIGNEIDLELRQEYAKAVELCISSLPVFVLAMDSFIVKKYRQPYKFIA